MTGAAHVVGINILSHKVHKLLVLFSMNYILFFYNKGKDGKFVPTHIRNPDIANRVAEHYIAFTNKTCDGNMNEG